eukprot:m.17841 g.17841  ORF g.17841 m.17841 type:complete len:399 (-) comp7588_c0_seq1:431-1627(-)
MELFRAGFWFPPALTEDLPAAEVSFTLHDDQPPSGFRSFSASSWGQDLPVLNGVDNSSLDESFLESDLFTQPPLDATTTWANLSAVVDDSSYNLSSLSLAEANAEEPPAKAPALHRSSSQSRIFGGPSSILNSTLASHAAIASTIPVRSQPLQQWSSPIIPQPTSTSSSGPTLQLPLDLDLKLDLDLSSSDLSFLTKVTAAATPKSQPQTQPGHHVVSTQPPKVEFQVEPQIQDDDTELLQSLPLDSKPCSTVLASTARPDQPLSAPASTFNASTSATTTNPFLSATSATAASTSYVTGLATNQQPAISPLLVASTVKVYDDQTEFKSRETRRQREHRYKLISTTNTELKATVKLARAQVNAALDLLLKLKSADPSSSSVASSKHDTSPETMDEAPDP